MPASEAVKAVRTLALLAFFLGVRRLKYRRFFEPIEETDVFVSDREVNDFN
jgi:hypothetical protein